MNLIAAKDALLLFVSQWMGTTLPRLLAVFAGLLICVLIIQSRWERRAGWTSGLLGLGFGLLLVAMGISTRVLHLLAQITGDVRLRLTIGLLSALVIGVTFEAIRRSRLQERYALLWMITGFVLLLGALAPGLLEVVGTIFGASYLLTVVGILFAFILLVAFHFSMAFSKHEQWQNKLAQRCAHLEARLEALERGRRDAAAPPEPRAPLPAPPPGPRRLRLPGARIMVPLLLGAAFVAGLAVGLQTLEPMIGDEVTHYYMLTAQARDLTRPNFYAHIPVGWEAEQVRRYPHVNAWHYLGALVYRATGRSAAAVQGYQLLFGLQFLGVAAWLARRRNGRTSYAPILYVLLLASLPVAAIFSVAFYQDVPAAAQVLTAFGLLFFGHWLVATLFLALAISFKITSFLFIPVFLALLLNQARAARSGKPALFKLPALRPAARLLGALLVLGACAAGWKHALAKYAEADFYPLAAFQSLRAQWGRQQSTPPPAPATTSARAAARSAPNPATDLLVAPYERRIIANHPGDLRRLQNYFVYGGVLIWPVMLLALARRAVEAAHGIHAPPPSTGWLFAIGLSYVIPAAYFLRTAPDARFFLPAVPFLLLPFVEWFVRLPRIKLALAVVAVLAVMQAGQVYAKIYNLRVVTPGIRQAISYLRQHPAEPRRLFMYPEGNFRLFPAPHDWYLNYALRDFWRNNNDTRLKILWRRRIGAIVIKKYLVTSVDPDITNLGVYPDFFVRQIADDPRFTRVFENDAVVIYHVPPPPDDAARIEAGLMARPPD